MTKRKAEEDLEDLLGLDLTKRVAVGSEPRPQCFHSTKRKAEALEEDLGDLSLLALSDRPALVDFPKDTWLKIVSFALVDGMYECGDTLYFPHSWYHFVLGLGFESLVFKLIDSRCVCKTWNEWYSEAAAELWRKQDGKPVYPHDTPPIFFELVNEHIQITNLTAFDHNASAVAQLTSLRSLTVQTSYPFDFMLQPKLKRLEIKLLPDLPWSSYTPSSLSNVLELRFQETYHMNQDTFAGNAERIFSGLTNLKSLSTIPSDAVALMTNLKSLHLETSLVKTNSNAYIRKRYYSTLTNLRELSLYFADDDLSLGIIGLSKLKKLAFTARFVPFAFPSLPDLKSLVLRTYPIANSHIHEGAFNKLHSLTQLSLFTSSTHFMGTGLTRLTNLTKFKFQHYPKDPRPMLDGISTLTGLTELSLAKVKDVSYSVLSSLTNLQTLSLTHCHLVSPPEFLQLTNLNQISVRYCNLVDFRGQVLYPHCCCDSLYELPSFVIV